MHKSSTIAYQIEVMGVVGYAVYQCQLLEETVSRCWLLNAEIEKDHADTYFNIWDIDETQAKNSKRTLGGLFRAIDADHWFTQSFRNRIGRFVLNRNRLIHTCFRGERSYSLRCKRDLKKLHGLASNLLREAFYFAEIFDAFLGMQSDLGIQYGILQATKRKHLDSLILAKQKRGVFKELSRVLKLTNR